MIRLVTFDALFTLITLRQPVYVQYSEAFSPYLGTLPPDEIARSFKLGVLFLPRFPSSRGGAQTMVRQPSGNCKQRGRHTVRARRRGGVRSFPERRWARAQTRGRSRDILVRSCRAS